MGTYSWIGCPKRSSSRCRKAFATILLMTLGSKFKTQGTHRFCLEVSRCIKYRWHVQGYLLLYDLTWVVCYMFFVSITILHCVISSHLDLLGGFPHFGSEMGYHHGIFWPGWFGWLALQGISGKVGDVLASWIQGGVPQFLLCNLIEVQYSYNHPIDNY